MDVEGYEFNILQGMKDTLKNASNITLLIELHGHLMTRDQIEELIDVLKRNNFIISFCSPDQKIVFNNKIVDFINRKFFFLIENYRYVRIDMDYLKKLLLDGFCLQVAFTKVKRSKL
jgi:hypothetical protein